MTAVEALVQRVHTADVRINQITQPGANERKQGNDNQ